MNVKVTYLKLKNFNAPYCILNLKKVEIDFTKMVNDILLFIGTNGSCKTYIMSQIHPFAYVSNIDARSGQDMIIEGEDGEKEIHYVNDSGDKYVIRHFYMHQKRGRKLHSYIEKNGVELNKTGLAGTFNEIIEIEFGIDVGYLRIIRLGSNVNNLVNLKSTDRKEFSVKLLTEVDEYMNDDKTAGELTRNLKSSLRVIVDKVKKLNIGDPVIYKTELDKSEEYLSGINDKKMNMVAAFSRYEGAVANSIDCSIAELMERIENINDSIEKHQRKIDSIDSSILGFRSYVHIGSLEELIDSYKERLNDKEKKLVEASTKIEMLSKSIKDLSEEGMDLDNKIKAYQEINDIDTIENELEFAKKFHDKFKKYYTDFTPECTKNDVMEDISLMQSVRSMILSAREFSDPARKMYIELRNNKKNVRGACTNKLVKLSTELSLCTSDICHDKASFDSAPFECNMKDSCFYYKAYKAVPKDRTMKNIEDDIQIVQECMKVIDCVNNIKITLDSRTKKFPYEVKMDNVILDIVNGTETFFDFDEVGQMVTFLETYDQYQANLVKMEKLEKELEYQHKQQDSIDGSIVARRKKVMIELSDATGELEKYRNKKVKFAEAIEETNIRIEELRELIELNSERKEEKSKLDESTKEYKSMLKQRKTIDEFKAKKDDYEKRTKEIDDYIEKLSKSIYDKKVVLSEYNKLQEEKALLEARYTKDNYIQKAVSPKTGIPLLFLHGHMGRAMVIANRIISAVFGDDLKLCKFIIDEKEFRIPYMKNGTVIDDVNYASQGELSIISLAISFALIEEFSGGFGYNVLLLDEVDGPLDKGNKEKFLRVLETQMQQIGCKQLFMITHNHLFENYPVDVFVTIDKDNSIDSYKNVNRIN